MASRYLMKQLKAIIKDLDATQLTLRLLSGEITLEDIQLNQEFLNAMLQVSCPWFEIEHVHCSRVHIEVPYTRLGRDPIRVTVDTVTASVRDAAHLGSVHIATMAAETLKSATVGGYSLSSRIADALDIRIASLRLFVAAESAKDRLQVDVDGIRFFQTNADRQVGTEVELAQRHKQAADKSHHVVSDLLVRKRLQADRLKVSLGSKDDEGDAFVLFDNATLDSNLFLMRNHAMNVESVLAQLRFSAAQLILYASQLKRAFEFFIAITESVLRPVDYVFDAAKDDVEHRVDRDATLEEKHTSLGPLEAEEVTFRVSTEISDAFWTCFTVTFEQLIVAVRMDQTHQQLLTLMMTDVSFSNLANSISEYLLDVSVHHVTLIGSSLVLIEPHQVPDRRPLSWTSFSHPLASSKDDMLRASIASTWPAPASPAIASRSCAWIDGFRIDLDPEQWSPIVSFLGEFAIALDQGPPLGMLLKFAATDCCFSHPFGPKTTAQLALDAAQCAIAMTPDPVFASYRIHITSASLQLASASAAAFPLVADDWTLGLALDDQGNWLWDADLDAIAVCLDVAQLDQAQAIVNQYWNSTSESASWPAVWQTATVEKRQGRGKVNRVDIRILGDQPLLVVDGAVLHLDVEETDGQRQVQCRGDRLLLEGDKLQGIRIHVGVFQWEGAQECRQGEMMVRIAGDLAQPGVAPAPKEETSREALQEKVIELEKELERVKEQHVMEILEVKSVFAETQQELVEEIEALRSSTTERPGRVQTLRRKWARK